MSEQKIDEGAVELEEDIDKEYSVKLTNTTNPDVTDDEGNPVNATEKHYDVLDGDEKVGKVVHHHNDDGGHFFYATLHGKEVPYDRQKDGAPQTAKAFIDGVANTNWHAKTVRGSLDEESIAGATLRPNSRDVTDDPKSKLDYITKTIGAMNAMTNDDLTKWYTQAMALIGKEASGLPSGASADSNSSSIDTKIGKGPKTRDPMPKVSVKEDVEEMFVGEDLSEEFKEKASTLFEAAVNLRAIVEVTRLEEEYKTRLDEELASITESTENNLDTYLDYVSGKWMEDNQVAVESSLRNEIMEEFIDGLKGLFSEHYIEMPEEKIDVIESLAIKVQNLESALDESINESVELKRVILESKRQDLINDMTEGLTLTQSEKYAALAEGIDFDGDLEKYTKKLSVVKEHYFATKRGASNIEEETFEVEVDDKNKSGDPQINRYVQAISKNVKH